MSASCMIVKGYSRSVIIDYGRGDLFFISHQYSDLIENFDRKKLDEIYSEFEDDDSRAYFEDFLDFLTANELAFLTPDIECFPKLSTKVNDSHILLHDIIIELDEEVYREKEFIQLCKDLTDLNCKDFQIRLLSEFNTVFLNKVIEIINNTNIHYLEIHGSYNKQTNNKILHLFIEKHPIISKIYVYGSPEISKYQTVNEIEGYHPISLGEVIYLDYSFDNGNCCGIINFENLNFMSFYNHIRFKKKNGCLNKKITIDKYGNIKNCPSLKEEYGNITDLSIKEVIEKQEFTKYWNIHKDQIETCKICEFRYNCTDCRAFIQNPNDIYSKPSKCSYNPITCEW